MDPLGWVCGICAEKIATARSFNPVSSGHSKCILGTQRVHKPSPRIDEVLATTVRLRDPQHWRDSQWIEHVLGKYIISDQR
jgi:hypothetical protein